MHDHWESALADLRGRLSEENFETWLGSIRFDGFDGRKLRVRIPNRFYADWIRTHYLDLLLESLRARSAVEHLEIDWKIDEALLDHDRRGTPALESSPPPRPSEPPRAPTNLNPKYRFESFVVGPSNQLAYAAAMAAGNTPGARYNPLFIYGGVGLGKTHLVNAVGHRVLADRPDARILYVSAERFTNEFIWALQNQRINDFRNRYRNQCDVLLMDDIQFLASREQTQEEFFHTFNALYHCVTCSCSSSSSWWSG
jgi:chromosomal replication initiator protein